MSRQFMTDFLPSPFSCRLLDFAGESTEILHILLQDLDAQIASDFKSKPLAI